MTFVLGAIAAVVAGYLLGSIPFGLLVTRFAGLGDLRKIGSGNIGATNVLRTGNKALAAAALAGDVLKGTAAVVLGALVGPPVAVAAGLAAFLGHLFPVWLRFRGGKGVATFFGVLVGLDWRLAAAFAVVWLLAAVATRYSSAGALAASLAAAIAAALLLPPATAVALAAMVALTWIRHAGNIRRLLAGTETRIGAKSTG